MKLKPQKAIAWKLQRVDSVWRQTDAVPSIYGSTSRRDEFLIIESSNTENMLEIFIFYFDL